MALVHTHLYASGEIDNLDLKDYFDTLLGELVQSYQYITGKINYSIEIEETVRFMDLNIIIPCGLIVNELVTNSIKHAFEDLHSAQISIFLRPIGSALRFEYRDNGKGIDEASLNGGSFGMDLLEILSNQIGKDIHHENDNGYRCHFTLNH